MNITIENHSYKYADVAAKLLALKDGQCLKITDLSDIKTESMIHLMRVHLRRAGYRLRSSQRNEVLRMWKVRRENQVHQES